MYPSFTLYPGAGFLYCESVSEFDPNVQPLTPMIEPKAVIADCQETDPVIRLMNKLRGLYDNHLVPLMNMDYTYKEDSAITDLESLTAHASAICNSTVKMMGKYYGIVASLSSSNIIGVDSFSSHIGMFMKNITKIHQQGIAEYDISWSIMSAFERAWAVSAFIRWMVASPEVMEHVITGSMLAAAIGSDNPIAQSFDGPIDLIKCMITDIDRITRLETTGRKRVHIETLISDRGPGTTSMYITEVGPSECPIAEICKAFAKVLKEVSTTCYRLQCDAVDGRISPDIYMDRVRVSITKIVNIFSVGVAHLFLDAYSLREMAAYETGMQEYTRLLLNTLKTV